MSNKTKLSLTIMSVTATFLASTLTACGNSKWHEVAGQPTVHTNDVTAERQTVPTRAEDLSQGQKTTVSSDRLVMKADPESEEDDEDIVLDHNEELTVVSTTPTANKGLIKVVTSDDREGYVPPQYLETKGPKQKPEDKYFMIQNIATEKLRVYENCATKDDAGHCHHKLVLETDMVAGEDTPDKSRRSNLGSYHISAWFKFYEDGKKSFPSFFDPNYPELPKAGASIEKWMSKDLLPNGKGAIRGSFGWYTAKIAPDADEQWTHGTFGWGEDGGKFIDIAKESRLDLRSRGCTRIENQAIAFVRDIMVPRSKIFKVYAKEDLKDKDLKRYANDKPKKWSWVLTKDGVRSTTATSSAKANAAAKESSILEKDSYSLDQKPKVASGNVYKIKEDSFKGTFLIDEGRFTNYQHPKELRVGGYKDKKLSSLVIEKK